MGFWLIESLKAVKLNQCTVGQNQVYVYIAYFHSKCHVMKMNEQNLISKNIKNIKKLYYWYYITSLKKYETESKYGLKVNGFQIPIDHQSSQCTEKMN